MRKVILAMTLVSLFCISGTGLAQYDDRNSDLMAYAGLLHLDRGGGNEFTIGARYSYNFDVYNSAEFGFGYTFPENADVFLYYLNYRLNASLKENKVKPFFTLGIGAVSYVFDSELDLEVSSQALDGTSFTFNIGGGFAGIYIVFRFL